MLKFILNPCISKSGPVATDSIPAPNCSTVTGVVCPYGSNAPFRIASSQHRHAVIDRCVSLMPKTGPVAAIDYSSVAPKRCTTLIPLKRHWLTLGQGFDDSMLHFFDDKLGVRLDPLILFRCGTTLPNNRGVTDQCRSVMSVRSRDDQSAGGHPAVNQTLSQAIRDSLSYTAVVQRNNHRRLSFADCHRSRP